MPEIVLTADGSTSVFAAELNEHYHSTHGALQESLHVFIKAGLYDKIPSDTSINILEIGFGTGLNTLLTAMEATRNAQLIQYTTIEKFPLNISIHEQLNYCTLLEDKTCDTLYKHIYQSKWEKKININEYFTLEKIKTDFKSINFSNQFNIVYFDAFSPTSQPELWQPDIFEIMYEALCKNGILVTYCAKGEVKRTLKNIGFVLETLQGPKGKREMIRARKV